MEENQIALDATEVKLQIISLSMYKAMSCAKQKEASELGNEVAEASWRGFAETSGSLVEKYMDLIKDFKGMPGEVLIVKNGIDKSLEIPG